jgi:chromosome segregation ATPase
MSDTFLEHVNSTPKKLVHNKLHDEINKLQIEVQKWEKADAEKEMKLGLFKKTIATLQQQIQELNKTLHQSRQLESTVGGSNDYERKAKELQEHYDTKYNQLQKENSTLSNNIQESIIAKDKLQAHLNKLQIENDKLVLSKQKLILNQESQSSQLIEKQYHIDNLQSLVSQHESTINNLTSELSLLKHELQNIKSENDILTQQTRDISNQLLETEQTLNKQLQVVGSTQESIIKSDIITGKTKGRPKTKRERK